jgi:hypothetical protein
MQFLLLIYENEQRFASGFNPAEMKEYEAFGQHKPAPSRAETPCSPRPKHKPCAFEMARR